MDGQKNHRIQYSIILFFILALALFLRIYKLSDKPIWHDEACIIADSQKLFSGIFTRPPTFNYRLLYPSFLKFWILLFGPSDFNYRFPSVVFGVLAVYAIYKLGVLLYSRKVGLWSAFLLSVSTFHIFHSQQVRDHSLFVLLSIVSFFLFSKLIFSPTNRNIFLHVAANLLFLNSYPLALFIVAIQYIAILTATKILPRTLLLKWVLGQTAVSLFYIILFLLPSRYYLMITPWWVPAPRLNFILETFFTFMFGGKRYGLEVYNLPKEAVLLPSILSICFLIFVFWAIFEAFFKGKRKGESYMEIFNTRMLLLWLLIPSSALYLVSYLKPLYMIKHLIVLLPPFLMLLALLLERVTRKAVKAILVVILVTISLFSIGVFYNYSGNVDWREPAQFILKHFNDNDAIIIYTSGECVPFVYYFDHKNKDNLKKLDYYGEWDKDSWREIFICSKAIIVGLKERKSPGSLDPLTDFRDKYFKNYLSWRDRNIWFAVSPWGNKDGFDKIFKELTRRHTMTMRVDFGDVTVYSFKKL